MGNPRKAKSCWAACSVFGLDEGARDIWTEVQKRIRARTGLDPDAFAFAVYDAVWVVARGYVASGATQDVERLKHAFMSAAATHYGATGWTVLDEAGDRRAMATSTSGRSEW